MPEQCIFRLACHRGCQREGCVIRHLSPACWISSSNVGHRHLNISCSMLEHQTQSPLTLKLTWLEALHTQLVENNSTECVSDVENSFPSFYLHDKEGISSSKLWSSPRWLLFLSPVDKRALSFTFRKTIIGFHILHRHGSAFDILITSRLFQLCLVLSLLISTCMHMATGLFDLGQVASRSQDWHTFTHGQFSHQLTQQAAEPFQAKLLKLTSGAKQVFLGLSFILGPKTLLNS